MAKQVKALMAQRYKNDPEKAQKASEEFLKKY